MRKKILWIYVLGVLFINYAYSNYNGSNRTSLKSQITIVAAESLYGELAQEIGKDIVQVKSIISNPSFDPHLFAVSPKVTRAITKAQIIIYNGAGYDPWMEQILTIATNKKNKMIINVADLAAINTSVNPNPHLWYRPDVLSKVAVTIAEKINNTPGMTDLLRKKVNENLAEFKKQNDRIMFKLKTMRAKYSGIAVTATEPVYNYTLEAIGLKILGLDLQWNIMNDAELSPIILANYQSLLINHKVQLLFYNKQVVNQVTKNLLNLARKYKIRLVGISETIPPNMNVYEWLSNQISLTEKALNEVRPVS